MGQLLPFPDRSAILIDRADDGRFIVEPYLCPLAVGRARAFDHAGDAVDYAEQLAEETGSGWALMCDV